MNAAHWHLVTVHLPVIGCPFTFLILFIAHLKNDHLWFQIGTGFLLLCLIGTLGAYFTGPPTYEFLQKEYQVEKNIIEQHAMMARAAFYGMILLAIFGLNILMRHWQEEPPSLWLNRSLLLLLFVICWLFAWSAHLGGQIRHPEIRAPSLIIFPELPE